MLGKGISVSTEKLHKKVSVLACKNRSLGNRCQVTWRFEQRNFQIYQIDRCQRNATYGTQKRKVYMCVHVYIYIYIYIYIYMCVCVCVCVCVIRMHRQQGFFWISLIILHYRLLLLGSHLGQWFSYCDSITTSTTGVYKICKGILKIYIINLAI